MVAEIIGFVLISGVLTVIILVVGRKFDLRRIFSPTPQLNMQVLASGKDWNAFQKVVKPPLIAAASTDHGRTLYCFFLSDRGTYAADAVRLSEPREYEDQQEFEGFEQLVDAFPDVQIVQPRGLREDLDSEYFDF